MPIFQTGAYFSMLYPLNPYFAISREETLKFITNAVVYATKKPKTPESNSTVSAAKKALCAETATAKTTDASPKEMLEDWI